MLYGCRTAQHSTALHYMQAAYMVSLTESEEEGEITTHTNLVLHRLLSLIILQMLRRRRLLLRHVRDGHPLHAPLALDGPRHCPSSRAPTRRRLPNSPRTCLTIWRCNWAFSGFTSFTVELMLL